MIEFDSEIQLWANNTMKLKKISYDDLARSKFGKSIQELSDKLHSREPRQILWHVVNNVGEPVLCTCGNACAWVRNSKNYRKTCSPACAGKIKKLLLQTDKKPDSNKGSHDPQARAAAQEKRKKTMIERYGVAHAAQHPDFLKKTKKTCEEKYGVSHPAQSRSVREKISTSLKNKFQKGSAAHDELIARRKNTSVAKYGVEHPMQSCTIQKKFHNTMLSRYGVAHALEDPTLNKKRQQTNQAKYGCSEAACSQLILDKIKKTNQERYGVDNYSSLQISTQSREILNDPLEFQNMLSGLTLDQAKDLLSVSLRTILNYASVHGLRHIFSSVKETQVESKIKNLLDQMANIGPVLQNVRSIISPQELDFFIPDKNLAIELNGLYWHCELGGNSKSKYYHQDKWRKCKDQGITLLQFTDSEINNKFSLVESKIKRYLNSSVPVIGARKLAIAQLHDHSAEKEFLNCWHIQGSTTNRQLVLAAYHNSVMVGISSWKYKGNQAELVRYATMTTYSFPGLMSRMIKQFVHLTNFTGSIMSYSNNMYGAGNVYQACGFENIGCTPPGYFYTKDYVVLESRLKYQKHKLLEYFDLSSEHFDLHTEWQIMMQQGYDRYWDAGHTVWVKKID